MPGVVYYAPGGGLGHVTRARRVLALLGLADAMIIGSRDIPPELEGNREAHRAWLAPRMRGRHLITDAFPCGIAGELEGIEAARIDHVARLLRWNEYRAAVPQQAPRFATTYLAEPLTSAHEAFLCAQSREVKPIEWSVRGAAATGPREAWLIVHSGPVHEVEELVRYALELQRLEGSRHEAHVVTTSEVALPDGFRQVAGAAYAEAARIITAAGFNTMLETEPYRERHHVVPFPRRFDDQFLRAARRRRSQIF